ncbi:diiron oxygenase [Micromonospora rubida]|uniref:Diiron oxygenase n=1 Tax=Micromonospora rubida TaxID=2697657 RepID=A0ABW7ST22_9ACTN
MTTMQTRRRAGEYPDIVEYRSSFKNWESRASVRVKPRRIVAEDDGFQFYFPPELVPAVQHPLVVERGPGATRSLLLSRLLQYLQFTTDLEAAAVIPVTLDISMGRSGLSLPGAMRRDAFKITTDEAWHAQFSDDMMTQIADRAGTQVRLPGQPQFLGRLARVHDEVDADLRGCTPLAFAIVSETLISAILSDLPRDTRLPGAVRELIADHAEDEGKHHAYFRTVLRAFWPALTACERRRLGPWFAELIQTFLEPDYRGLSYALFEIGLDDAQVAQVLAESYPDSDVRAGIAGAARATVGYLTEVGALAEPAAHDAFVMAGLIDA